VAADGAEVEHENNKYGKNQFFFMFHAFMFRRILKTPQQAPNPRNLFRGAAFVDSYSTGFYDSSCV